MSDGWLPALVLFESYGGNWDEYVEAIYQYFRRDFLETKPSFESKRVGLKRHPVEQGKEATFWHLISEGESESGRVPDIRRCERIRWPRPMIEAVTGGRVRCWRNQRNKDARVVIALDDFSYLVVLADRGRYVLLWTAYSVEREHMRRKLRKEYDRSQKC